MTIFSMAAYSLLLDCLQSSGRPFIPFDKNGSGLILRHDVDYDLTWSTEIAKLNADKGIKATFFVQVASPLYNIFDDESLASMEAMVKAGQMVGLHYHQQGDDLDLSKVEKEMQILSTACPSAQRIVSWHNPGSNIAELNTVIESAGFVSAYSDCFFHKDRYFSDSNCRNTADELAEKVLGADSDLVQVLTHPYIWTRSGNDIREILRRTFDAKVAGLNGAFGQNPVWASDLAEQEEAAYLHHNVMATLRACYHMHTGADIVLTPLDREDIDPLYRWINDRELVILNGPYKPVHRPAQEAWFESVTKQDDLFLFGIRIRSDDTLIGYCQLHDVNPIHRKADLQIRIGETAHQNKGYGSQALQLLLDFGFNDLNLNRIQLHVFSGNARATAVYEKLGFKKEGVQREAIFIDGHYQDLILMGILRKEYMNR